MEMEINFVTQRETTSAPVNIFVLGLDDHNRDVLESMRNAHLYRFYGVLTYEEIYQETISFNKVLRAARDVIDLINEPVDAIIGFWDFPVSSIVQLLRQHYGLPSVPLEEVVMCEHKYWSRLIQQQVITEFPRFALFDPKRDNEPPRDMGFPMWIKPVKSFASMLAIGVEYPTEFEAARAKINEGIGRFGEPFEELMEHVELPEEIASAGGKVCIAEEAIYGQQVTVEGYRYQGEVVMYGTVDSIHYEGTSSFLRYQYPSALPEPVLSRLTEISRKVIEAIGLEGLTFNIEYFWDPATDEVKLLEINPRHSQSHAQLFADVDGISNHEVLLQLALGREPHVPRGKGKYPLAATWFVRRFSDGIVHRHPSAFEVAEIERRIPGTTIEIDVRAGEQLSVLHGQDNYSYCLATIFIGAMNQTELNAKFDQVVSELQYEIADIDETEVIRPKAS